MKTAINDAWLASSPEILPDFIIAGAMKAGTSSIHQLLQRHPDVSIPEEEVHFLDLDDTMEHPDFGNPVAGVSPGVEFLRKPEAFWTWYERTLHGPAASGQKIGEDSTTYLSSRLAIRRIAAQKKPIKLIVCLRQPSLRAYSNYWHLHKTRRVACSFEKLLQTSPGSVLHRSCYGQQMRELLHFIPRERVYVVVLETLRDHYDEISKELCEFVGVDPARLPAEADRVHSNAGIYPRSHALQNVINACFPAQQSVAYHAAMPFGEDKPSVCQRVMDFSGRALSKFNRSDKSKAPPMWQETKHNLDAYFAQECADLSALVGLDLDKIWFGE